MPDVARLVELVRSHQPCVVLTGAGISQESGIPTFRGQEADVGDSLRIDTESGIPDFRSQSGIWRRFDPMVYAHVDAFRRDPARVWEFYALRLDVASEAEPNDGHRALADLERRGWVRAVVTQNVDGLHTRAGSRDVLEVHGSLREAECLACRTRVPMADVLAELPLPPCPSCGEVLKPGVVMFGELLPAGAIERAQELAREARLLLVVGSSLQVYPVAALPEETLRAGGALVIVNRGETPWDSRAELVVDGGAGETLPALAEALPGMVG